MAGLTHYQHLLRALRRGVQAQQASLESLERTYQSESVRLSRLDQARRLDELRAQIERDIATIEREESIASHAFNKVHLISGLAMLGIGGLHAAVRPKAGAFPLWKGLAENTFNRTQPFGTILVCIGPGGIPDDVVAIPLSRSARNVGATESVARAHVERQGHTLMTPHQFLIHLDQLKGRVLAGDLTLPVTD